MNNDSYKGECENSGYDDFLKNLSDPWTLLLVLAVMSGITPEKMQKMKEEDEKAKEYADWCPARKLEHDSGATYPICGKTGEICDGCKSQFEDRRFEQEFHFDK